MVTPMTSEYPQPTFPLQPFVPQSPTGRTVQESARTIPVIAECDLAFLGGGPAGVCAAAAAARMGKTVVLVERYGYFGGTATAASVNIWHELYGTDHKTKVIGGIGEEIIRRLQKWGGAENSAKDGETGTWAIDTELAKLAMDDVVIGSGVKVLLHTWLAGVVRQGRRITAAVVESKSGRGAIMADSFIDCTGDADLVRRAGAATQSGNGAGYWQPPTLCFRVMVGGGEVQPLHEVQAELHKLKMDYNGQPYPCFLWGQHMPLEPREIMLAGTRVLGVNVGQTADFTRAEVEARYQMRWVVQQMRHRKGWQQMRIVDIAAQIGARESYRIVADHQYSREDLLEGRWFEDAIAQGTYRVDIHHVKDAGLTFEYLDGRREIIDGQRRIRRERWDGAAPDAPPRDTLCYFVPYRSLIVRDLDNVLAAGRNIGADHVAAAGLRVMINAMSFGQAAGTAAAMAPGGNVRQVPIDMLRTQLVRDGVPLLPKP